MGEHNAIAARSGSLSRLCWTLALSAFSFSLCYVALFRTRYYSRDAQVDAGPEVTWPSTASVFELDLAFRKCLEHNFVPSSLKNVPVIQAAEFLDRRNRLAKALHQTSGDAFIVEPGFTFYYYANVSQPDWEPWEPEERPFLMIIQPQYSVTSDEIEAKTYFLAPSFEVQRVLSSNIPYIADSDIIPWEEEQDPYFVLADYMSATLQKPTDQITIVADDELRYFIAKGVEDTGMKLSGLNVPASNVRESKSSTEIAILKAANTATVAGLSAVQKCVSPGLTERVIETSLTSLYSNHGLMPFFNLVLIEENAALPHGGRQGGRELQRDDLILIDVGVHLHGYSSDISRTLLMDSALTCNTTIEGCQGRDDSLFAKKLQVWDIVLKAQQAAISMMRPGNNAASVDLAARKVIDDAGYEGAFTHRLGHGIGIKAHEPPYLNRGNFGRYLSKGMCFTAEPGIYIPGVFGVRHEDVILVTEGDPELLTAGLSKSPWDLRQYTSSSKKANSPILYPETVYS